jgi:hypothetical protein
MISRDSPVTKVIRRNKVFMVETIFFMPPNAICETGGNFSKKWFLKEI